MLSVVIPTHESERLLVRTLAALVPGAMNGLVSEVVVTDADSHDATEQVADIAGCRYMSAGGTLGSRLKEAAASTRTPWLMFLRPGSVPEAGWITACEGFMTVTGGGDTPRAAVFRPPSAADLLRPGLSEVLTLLRVIVGGGTRPEQGLLIARRFYDALGGHPDSADAEADILRKLGRRRVAMLSAAARSAV